MALNSPRSGFAEAATKTVNFPEHTPASVKLFLQFCYTGDYKLNPASDDAENQHATPAPAQLDIKVYLLADCLIADDVKSFALEKFDAKMDPGLDRALFEKLWKEDLAGIVDAVYANTAIDYSRRHEIYTVVVDAVVKGILEYKLPSEYLEKQFQSYHDCGAGIVESCRFDAVN